MPKKPPHFLKFVFAAAALAAAIIANINFGPQYREALIVKVFDGDTVKLDSGEKVRLIGIDTPERHDSDKLAADARKTGQNVADIKAMGDQAYQYTSKWLAGQRVRLEFDKEKRDKYGRLLAYVYLPFPRPALSNSPRSGYIVRIDDKKWYFVNATIVQAGYAVPMPIEPNIKNKDIIETLYQQAKQYQLGLWAKEMPKPKVKKNKS